MKAIRFIKKNAKHGSAWLGSAWKGWPWRGSARQGRETKMIEFDSRKKEDRRKTHCFVDSDRRNYSDRRGMESDPIDIKKISTLIIRQIEDINIMGRWLPMHKACKYSEMSKNTLMKCIKAGDIKASKRRGKWIVDRRSIDKYYESDIETVLFNDIAQRVKL